MKPNGSLRIEQIESYGVVVDASVAIKWHLRDELLSSEATALLEEYAAGRLWLTAPALIRYEMASALEMARRRARISDNDSFVEMETFLQYGIDESADSGELDENNVPELGLREVSDAKGRGLLFDLQPLMLTRIEKGLGVGRQLSPPAQFSVFRRL